MSPKSFLSVCICVYLWLFSSAACAQEAPEPIPGLIVTFSSAGATDARPARIIALDVPAGQSPTPFLKSGPFTAVFTGNINLRIRDTLTFSATGRGSIKVTVNDQPLLTASSDDLSKAKGTPLRLSKGKNKVIVEYTSPASGDAQFRLLWSDRDFPPEPVSPLQLTTDVKAPAISTTLREGRNLFATSHCVRCHAVGWALPTAETMVGSAHPTVSAMPELAMDVPNLSDVGERLNATWMAKWIENPRAMRPTATMPRVVKNAGDASDIAAYLKTLTPSPGTPGEGRGEGSSADEKSINTGGHLFATLGCIACHTAPDATKDDPRRTTLSHVKEKFQPAALKAFLLNPQKDYAWIRMPNFRFSDAEATNLTAFLLAKSGSVASVTLSGDPARGKTLFESSGCLNCHRGPGTSTLKSPPLAQIAKADASKGCKAMDYSFAQDQLAALSQFLSTQIDSLTRDNSIEIAEREFTASNCMACHTRDKQSDYWSQLDEAKSLEAKYPASDENSEKYAPDQSRPKLTWTGEKLQPDWLEKFVTGQIPYKPRPFIRARMPGFPLRGKLIAPGLVNEHGLAFVEEKDPAPDPALAAIGQKLVGKNGGFACNTCHAIGSTPATAAFEAPGINFAYAKDRLRHEYFVRWTRNPIRMDPETRMPKFIDSEGKTTITDTLDGVGAAQFNAIWNFLLQGKDVKSP